MSTAGPELPPHLLAKRKRFPDAEVQASSQDESTGRHSALRPSRSRSSSNSFSATSDSPKRRRTLGPSLPVPPVSDLIMPEDGLRGSNEANGEEGCTENKGAETRRILGPSLPPAPLSERPSSPPNSNDSSSDDDDFGPSLPSTPNNQPRPPQSAIEPSFASEQSPPKPKREEWMLIPPSQSDWSSRIDPTKLRNRKFNTGKGAKAPPPKSSGNTALWTETPEQKQRRLADEVMGVAAKPGSAAASAAAAENEAYKQNPRRQAEALETERRVQEYNAQHRGASLYSEHQKRPRKEQEDDPSARAFDREKDVVRGTKIGRAQKQEMLNRAADFAGRFTKGSYL